MNNRQRKKIARIENNWYRGKKIDDCECPCCSWCALNDDEFKHHKTLSREEDCWGKINWEFEVKCPHCKTIFKYCDSNM